ncbi:RHS repeat-associated core domain-containing protein [Opitutus sp. ER46]|uniref:RHS repeat-associated core domain-containing protein n=1 Tax=Opitutus sp. ER46 TaxID=2161864 RepID=UPI000D310314|nr:RHS repeat-associated core domain-containing protein [Opitutus sp. ER46]PTY01286.1 hypothetical protein DB354_00050 [Opitutus sp. ER46]
MARTLKFNPAMLFLHPKPAAFSLPTDALEYDADNQLSKWNNQTVICDADGNMTTGPSPSGAMKTYSYDARNRLTSFDGSGYTYNPDGLRTAVTGTGAASFLVDPNAALSRVLRRTKGGVTTYYVYGHGLLYQESGGVTRTYHGNQVGSTLVLTDDSQNVTDRIGYAPYGTITERTGSTDTPFLFNGEYGVMTDTNGLICMRNRYYNPRLMRFLNADPIGFGGGLNWYAFVSNNPISKTDPSGLQDFIAGFGPMPAPVPPGSYTYNGPTTVGGMAKAVGQSYVQAGQAFGGAVKDIATFGGNTQKQELFSAIMTPVKVGGYIASGEGFAISAVALNAGKLTGAQTVKHMVSWVANGFVLGTLAGDAAYKLNGQAPTGLGGSGPLGAAGTIAGEPLAGGLLDVGLAFYTPPQFGGEIALATWVLAAMEAAGSSGNSSATTCKK